MRYFTVVDKEGGAALGHVWASDEDDAAAYQPRQAAEARGIDEGIAWVGRLREAKARGTRPSQALTDFLVGPESPGRGRPLPGSLTDAPTADVVKALARADQ